MIFIENNKFAFGKYKNKDIYEVLNENPSYIRWCLNNINEFKDEIPKDIYDKVKEKPNRDANRLDLSGANSWLITWLM